jgi:methylmalonyl-CoA mutase
MTVPAEELRLASDFEPATLDEWRRLALGVLRKAGRAGEDTPPDAVEELLGVTTYDGIRIAPLYTKAPETHTGTPGVPPFTRGSKLDPRWDVRQRHQDPDPDTTHAAILADLENGVTSLWLDLGPHALDPADLPRLLDGVYLDLAGVVLDAGSPERAGAAAEALLRLAADRGTPASGNLGFDPLGWAARTGAAADLAPAAGWARRCADQPGLRAITVDATAYHDAGGSDADELGAALATGVAYLRALTDGGNISASPGRSTSAGLDVAAALGQLEFRYAAGADQFLTVAKFRAARRLWARVAQECGAAEAGAQRQHAVTSSAMMTARDPWVNLLRTTLACFAAGIGGADAVTVQPFDARLGLPDGFARRIARNTQSLLLDEAHVGRVLDPAGGSWYVERLTDELAEAAWTWFQTIEAAGGMAAALAGGVVSARFEATWARRRKNLALRRDAIVGVSEFPNLDEQRPVRRSAPAPDTVDSPLATHRYAEEFEELRDRSDAHAAATGSRPTVVLVTLGPVAAYSARVAFAANLFAAGGITTTTVPAADLDMSTLDATVVCLCSSDRLYAEQAESTVDKLRTADVRQIWLAGRGTYPRIYGYVYAGCDAISVLRATLLTLEVAV